MFPTLINFIGAEICHNFYSFQILELSQEFHELIDLHASYSLISYLFFIPTHCYSNLQRPPMFEEAFSTSSSLTSSGKALSMRIYSETWGSNL